VNVCQLLVRSARVFPDNPALFHGSTLVCDYRELARRAAAIGAYLQVELGLQPGERVAVFMGNIPQYLETLYGAWFAGLVVVPINARLHPHEAEFIIRDAGAAALFVSSDLAGAFARTTQPPTALRAIFVPGTPQYAALYTTEPMAAPVFRLPDDLAWLFYTSGTTGRPKGAMQSHRNLLAMTACYFTDIDQVRIGDGMVYAAPMSHGAGMYNFAYVLAAAPHIVPESGGFDPAELVALAARHRAIAMFAAPTMVKRLVDHIAASGTDVDGFKTIIYGGGPMYVEDIRAALKVLGERLVQIYGQGESPMTITALSRQQLADRAHPRHAQRIASVGVAQSLVEVRVADAHGNAVPAGECGEVMVRGDTVMLGYWNQPEASAAAFCGGWLRTGDIGRFDSDGFLTLKDRSKDMIISGGSNIYPREVEEVLMSHPAVDEVSVVGRPDAEWGEQVVAFVVAKPGASVDAAALDALCLAHIARFKRPKQYRFVAALPKNNYGKILKTALRSQLVIELSHGLD
jgi:long-chain acyl-CoA synthetase